MKTVLVNVAEQVKKDVNECLTQHGFPVLDDHKCQLLHGQVCDLASPTNTITKLMSKAAVCVNGIMCVCVVWGLVHEKEWDGLLASKDVLIFFVK